MTDQSRDSAYLPREGFALSGLGPARVLDGRGVSAGDGLLMLLRNALDDLAAGQILEVQGTEPSLGEDLKTWCRITANELLVALDSGDQTKYLIRKGTGAARWDRPDWGVRLPRRGGGQIDVRDWLVGRAGQIPDEAPVAAAFVPRGAVPEVGMPPFPYTINRRDEVWADNLGDLYEQSKLQQWNATTDIPWDQLEPLPDDLERSVCQVMTFLAENEYAALYIPAKFLSRINAQLVEPVLFLCTVINDEARHVEAFTKRALANGGGLQYSVALTAWSLQTLLVQEDYFRSSFLLHVLGEGTFLDLLEFIEKHAPDPVTAEVVRRARADEGRHVGYGVAHVRHQLRRDPTRADDLVAAAEERSAALQAAGGANPHVMQALATLAGGGSRPDQVARGLDAVRDLYRSMDAYRVRRMLQIGLDRSTAEKISELHTANFM